VRPAAGILYRLLGIAYPDDRLHADDFQFGVGDLKCVTVEPFGALKPRYWTSAQFAGSERSSIHQFSTGNDSSGGAGSRISPANLFDFNDV
jgi:hypothetical protein